MSNGTCHVGAENRAKIEANEKRIIELSHNVSEMMERIEQTQKELLIKVDKVQDDFNRRLDRMSDKFSGRPSWVLMLGLSALSSISVGLIVYLSTH